MSDFLMRLAERQLGQIASVDARVPELYATAATTPRTIVEDIPTMVIGNRESTPVPAPTVSPTSRQNRDVALPDHGEVEAPSMKHSGWSPAMAKRETPLLSPSVTEEQVAAPPTFVPPALLVAPRQTISAPRQSQSERRDSSTTAAETPVAETLSSPGAEPTPIITTKVLLPAAPPRPELKTLSREESAAPHHQPGVIERSVHVTIGCIEVTALSAAPAERRASEPRKASMSLQDYLARRRGRPRE